MKSKRLIIFFLLVINACFILAQTLNVAGYVTDERGEPLVGVSVRIKETIIGTATDIEGKFSLSNVKYKSQLIFTHIGCERKEVSVTSKNISVILKEDEKALDQIIVVAYGKTSKAGYVGSASTISKKEISKSQVSSVSRLLQGSASGVQSVASSGQPGSDASIYIRGIGSVNASSRPLYIIDGAPFDGDLNSINPADIESVSVLKDAASTAIYGSRAGNGLIIISTKQGSKNKKAIIEASFKYGVSSRAVSDYKRLSTNDYFELYWEALRNQEVYVNGKSFADAADYASKNIVSNLGINPYGSNYPQPVELNGKLVPGIQPLWDDDWSKEYTQEAHRTEAQINISGGGETSTYFISLGYLDDQGIALASDFKRYTGRINLNTDIKPWLKLSTGVSLTHSKQNAPPSEDLYVSNTLNFARVIPNFYPIWVRNPDGSFKLDRNNNRIYDYGDYRPSGAVPRRNHLGSSQYDFNRVVNDIASIRTTAEIALYKGLVYRGSINIDYTSTINHNYENPKYGGGAYNHNPGSVSKESYRSTGFTGNNILTYNTTINHVHNISVLAGQEYYEYNNSSFYGSRDGFPVLGLEEPIAASQLVDFSGSSDQYKLLSFFANATYNYNHKYYGSASIRRDGSSRFSPDARWGTFWSIGGSWRLSEEECLCEIGQISNLTLRANYGGQGNDELGTYYAYKPLFSIENNLGESGFVTSSLENNNLKWETNLNFNIGLDFSLLSNRLRGSVEYFNRRSKDLLFRIPKALSTGYRSYLSNAGAIKNVGYEFSLDVTPVRTKDWTWSVSLNATHYKNKITALPQDRIELGNYVRQVGGSIYDFFLVEWAGVNPCDGQPQWYKTNENNERVITTNYTEANNSKSKIVAGTSLPDLSGGFGTSLQYKDFEFSALFAYSIGGKIYNDDKHLILHNGSSAGRAMSTDVLDRWTPENRNTNIPRLQVTNGGWTQASTRFLINADYLRLKNITLGYNLPATTLNKVGLKTLKVYVQAENLLTVFGEEGMDPEQTIGGSTNFRYPAMKTISFGLNVSF